MSTPNIPIPGTGAPSGVPSAPPANKPYLKPIPQQYGSDALLSASARADGLKTKTPLGALPADFSPDWKAACEALEKALDALDEYDAENDAILSHEWQQNAEAAERRYVAAIQSGNKPPARPRGGYVRDAEDKRPGIVGEWYRLRAVKDKADHEAWKLLVQLAPSAVPDAHTEIVAAGEAYVAAQEAMNKARDTFDAAFNARQDLEAFASGAEGGHVGLPAEVAQTNTGERIDSASVLVENALRWLDRNHGPADTGTRYPAMRVVDANGSVFTVTPVEALRFESMGATFIDGFAPESEVHGLRRGGRANVSDRVGPRDSKKFNAR